MLQAINYLLARPDVSSPQKSSATVLASPVRAHTSHRRYMSDGVPQTPSVASTVRGNDPTSSSRLYNFGSVSESRLGTASRSKIAKRDGTAAEEFGRQTGLQSTPKSTRTYRSMASTRQDREDEQPPRQVARNAGQSEAEEDLFEGLENVRACCNGKHDGESPALCLHLLTSLSGIPQSRRRTCVGRCRCTRALLTCHPATRTPIRTLKGRTSTLSRAPRVATPSRATAPTPRLVAPRHPPRCRKV